MIINIALGLLVWILLIVSIERSKEVECLREQVKRWEDKEVERASCCYKNEVELRKALGRIRDVEFWLEGALETFAKDDPPGVPLQELEEVLKILNNDDEQ